MVVVVVLTGGAMPRNNRYSALRASLHMVMSLLLCVDSRVIYVIYCVVHGVRPLVVVLFRSLSLRSYLDRHAIVLALAALTG